MTHATSQTVAANRAESIEDADTLEGAGFEDVLDVEYTARADGTVTEIRVALTLGGPSVWVSLFSGFVSVSWGGETARAPILEPRETVLEAARERFMLGVDGVALHE